MKSENESIPASQTVNPWCFYSTDGDVMGPIERRHLETIWRSGQFPEDALAYDPAGGDWSSMREWFPDREMDRPPEKPSVLPEKKFQPPPPEMAPLPPKRSHQGQKRNKGEGKVLKWQILAFFSILISAMACLVFFVRGNTAIGERAQFAQRVESLQAELQKRTESLERLAETVPEALEPDRIKGRFVLRAPDGAMVPQRGVKVLLYNRRDLEKHLETFLASLPEGIDVSDGTQQVVNNLPFPVSTTTTDSDGIYEFRLQAPGEFVLHTNVLSADGNSMMWFLGFDSTMPPHTPIDFKETNRSTSLVPGLMVVPAR